MPVIPAFERKRQVDQEFKDILGYVMSSRLAPSYMRSCLKNKNEKEKKKKTKQVKHYIPGPDYHYLWC